jgi:hypothetical protein
MDTSSFVCNIGGIMNPLAILIIGNTVAALVVLILLKTVFAPPKYVVNYHSKEIHKKDSKDTRCRINNMTNCADINDYQMRRLLKKGYNGCCYCNKDFDTDMINYKKGLKK